MSLTITGLPDVDLLFLQLAPMGLFYLSIVLYLSTFRSIYRLYAHIL
jgi:hypothetical protein